MGLNDRRSPNGHYILATGPDNGSLWHNRGRTPMLSDVRIHVRFKLSALWVAVMLCYIYGDLFGFFQQKTVAAIVAGNAGIIGTQTGLLAAASMMAVPSVMVFLSLVLPPKVSRWVNVVLGLAFTGIIIATMTGAWIL